MLRPRQTVPDLGDGEVKAANSAGRSVVLGDECVCTTTEPLPKWHPPGPIPTTRMAARPSSHLRRDHPSHPSSLELRPVYVEFPTPIFDIVLKRMTVGGSIVGPRQDLAEALAFAAEDKMKAHIHCVALEDVNEVFSALKS